MNGFQIVCDKKKSPGILINLIVEIMVQLAVPLLCM